MTQQEGTTNSYSTSDNGNSQYNSSELDLKHSKLSKSHEKTILTENNKHELDKIDKLYQHEQLLKDKDLGWLGRFFGGKELTSLNISGILILFLILSGVILSIIIYCNEWKLDGIVKLWGILTPLITLTLGYIFGSKNDNIR